MPVGRSAQVPRRPTDSEFTTRGSPKGMFMQIGEAARTHAGTMAGTPRADSAAGAAAKGTEAGRDLDSRIAGRELAVAVVERMAILPAARAEPARIEAARKQASTDPAGSVASVLRSAVAASGAQADDVVKRLLEQVDGGIASGERALERMGYDPKQVAAAAVAFRERLSARVDSYAQAQQAAVESAQVSAAHVRRERGRIELVTQDGDVVRIAYRARESERVTVAGSQGGQGSALSARIATDQSARIRVSVRGELDAGELAAIEDFLGKIDALAMHFYDGDAEAAFAAAAALQVDPEEIVRYAVKLSVRERYAMTAQVQAPPVPSGQSATTTAAAPASAATSSPVAGAPSTAAPAAGDRDQASATAPAAAATAPAELTPSAPQADGVTAASASEAPASGLDTIRRFVQSVLETAATPLSVYGAALQWGVRMELTEALLDEARSDARPRPGADLLVAVMHTAADVAELEANPEAVYAPVRLEPALRAPRVARD